MLFAAPRFWAAARPTPLARLLQPLGWAYGLGVRLQRSRIREERLPVPVVSVGNITLGGSGKTPLVIALAHEFQRRGYRVAVLLRGYGSKRQRSCLVGYGHGAADVGDEALEYRQQASGAQVWVGPDRVASGRSAVAAGASLLLLDDGLQHWRLARDCDITVLDRRHGLGNGLVFPAGPLREPAHQLGRADLLVLTGGPSSTQPRLPWPIDKPTFTLASWIEPPAALKDQPLAAFCGIGLPMKFFAALEQAGMRVVERVGFPDHHPYDQSDLQRLQRRSDAHQATLVTTLKDWQRLPEDWRQRVVALPLLLDRQAVVAIADAVQGKLARLADG